MVHMILTHVPYLIPDYQQAQDFLETLGFELSADEISVDGKRFLAMASPGGGVELQLIETPIHAGITMAKKKAGIVEFVFSVADMSEVMAVIKEKGLPVHREPVETPYGTTAIFEDVFGYLWDLVERPKPPQ